MPVDAGLKFFVFLVVLVVSGVVGWVRIRLREAWPY
jgi:hypothetical protein